MTAERPDPFASDVARDFLAELRASTSRVIPKALRAAANVPEGRRIRADVGKVAWAACELVALAFGYGDPSALDDATLDVVEKFHPKEQLRQQALKVLARIAAPKSSDLAAQWRGGPDGEVATTFDRFENAVGELTLRLEAARRGRRSTPKAKLGDVIGLATSPGAATFAVVQIIGPGEVAVFSGVYGDDAMAMAAVMAQPARRVPATVSKLLRRGRLLANAAVRSELKRPKVYAGEFGEIEHYVVAAANGSKSRIVGYAEAKGCDPLRTYDEDDLRAIARNELMFARIRPPEQREAALAARNAERWAARRRDTTPAAFGDTESLAKLAQWIAEVGAAAAIQSFAMEANAPLGYGRPAEWTERRSYAFAGIVAVWRGAWAASAWPLEAGASATVLPCPVAPTGALLDHAVAVARVLAARVITRDAELRLIWGYGPDRGVGLYEAVVALRTALE